MSKVKLFAKKGLSIVEICEFDLPDGDHYEETGVKVSYLEAFNPTAEIVATFEPTTKEGANVN